MPVIDTLEYILQVKGHDNHSLDTKFKVSERFSDLIQQEVVSLDLEIINTSKFSIKICF